MTRRIEPEPSRQSCLADNGTMALVASARLVSARAGAWGSLLRNLGVADAENILADLSALPGA